MKRSKDKRTRKVPNKSKLSPRETYNVSININLFSPMNLQFNKENIFSVSNI